MSRHLNQCEVYGIFLSRIKSEWFIAILLRALIQHDVICRLENDLYNTGQTNPLEI